MPSTPIEKERPAAPAVVERFLPCTISRQRQGPGFPVPQGERIHAIQALQCGLDAPFAIASRTTSGIRSAREIDSHGTRDLDEARGNYTLPRCR